MIDFFQNILRITNGRKAYFPAIVESTHHVDASDIFNEIFEGKKDGLLIRDFLSKDELNNMKLAIKKWEADSDLINTINNGKTIGKSMFDIEVNNEYFALAHKYKTESIRIFKASVADKIHQLLQALNPSKKITAVQTASGQEYLQNSIRILEPNKGGLHIHSDLLIHQLSVAAGDIMQQIDSSTILSIFITIQQSEEGGRLVLYNKRLKETDTSMLCKGDLHQNIRDHISQYEHNKINIPEGALILFNAGQQWHAIEPITGKSERITIGCFIGKHKERDEILFWA